MARRDPETEFYAGLAMGLKAMGIGMALGLLLVVGLIVWVHLHG